jgi:thioredoxin-like negative regulator of GroEL
MLLVLMVATSLQAQDFYEQQLQNAKNNLAGARTVQAVDELRIAAFGFLDRPPLLVEALVRLAVAQNSLGQTEAARSTVDRFFTVEQRFPFYASLTLDEKVKSSFEALVLQSVARNVIAATPSVARLVKTVLEQVGDLPVEQRSAAFEAGAKKEPRNIQWPLTAARDAASRNSHDEVLRWTSRAFAIESANMDATTLAIHARAARGDCREALAAIGKVRAAELEKRPELRGDQVVCLVKTGKMKEAAPILAKLPESVQARADVAAAAKLITDGSKPPVTNTPSATALPTTRDSRPAASSPSNSPLLARTRSLVQQGAFAEAVDELRKAVDTEPRNRSYRLALLEAAVLAKDWRIASSQLGAVNPLKAGEELYMFYSAVTLFETGRTGDARDMMERARGRMNSSPLVDYYIKAVLGTT